MNTSKNLSYGYVWRKLNNLRNLSNLTNLFGDSKAVQNIGFEFKDEKETRNLL